MQEGSLFTSEFDNAIEKAKDQATKQTPITLPEGKVKDILIAPDVRLKMKAKPVEKIDAEIIQLVSDMFLTIARSHGMGLAANQIGVNKRVIVMDVAKLAAYEDTVPQDILTHGKFAFINPEVIEFGTRSVKWAEGCLSVPGFQFEINRPGFIVIRALDLAGNLCELRAAGLLAACVQHEIDHLDGKLFIDYISKLKRDMVVKKLQKFRKKGTMVVKAHQAPSL